MTQLYTTTPEALWALIGAPQAIASWHPAIASSDVDGKTRRCTLADGATIVEEISHHSDAEKSYSYRIVESPLPMRDYVSTIRVESDGAGAKLVWESQFEAVGAPAGEVEAMVRGLYQAGLDSVASQLGHS
jgi:hypothetical protein